MIEQGTKTIAIPPGETIKEQLDMRHWTQKTLANKLGITEKHVSHLLNGKSSLTPEMAMKLEDVLGVPAAFWMNLEAIYQEKRARVKREQQTSREEALARQYPYPALVKLGWVPAARKAQEKAQNLRRFFEVADLAYVTPLPINFRRSSNKERATFAARCWVQKLMLEGRDIDTEPYDRRAIEASLPHYRALTKKIPIDFYDDLREDLAQKGVVFMILPHVADSFLNGAHLHDGNMRILGVSTKGKFSDIFWFTFFHELAHILLNHPSGSADSDRNENEADQFAADLMVDPAAYKAWLDTVRPMPQKTDILAFAQTLSIDPGIVVGRLQHDGIVKHHQFNELRTKYDDDAFRFIDMP